MTTLTRRQKEMLDYLEQHIAEHGYAPTLDEIGRRFGLASLATVHKHLTNLEEKGVIRRRAGHSRALEVVQRNRPSDAVDLPLLGAAAAGRPIEAFFDGETVSVPRTMVRRSDSFVLRVRGDSMKDDGILDGDLVVVESRPIAETGEIVVAVIDGEATVKRFHRERGGRIRLQPANDAYPPMIVSERDLEVRGVVVALLRSYAHRR
ncbi:MAG TPA: transcriptional repressor LexA [Candidatus Binatia bacterium]|nr:transcriptional repressor LexA [Candidatus Binatia bacterium]